MKQYKKIFQESISENNVVANPKLAKTLIDVSNLDYVFGDTLDWYSAIKSPYPGYRLPTIQELYSIRLTRGYGIGNQFYWSSSVPELLSQKAWAINPLHLDEGGANIILENKKAEGYTIFVKDENPSYQNKIDSLLIGHFVKNYNKSPKEADIISNLIKRIIDEIEIRGTPISQIEADKIFMYVNKILFE